MSSKIQFQPSNRNVWYWIGNMFYSIHLHAHWIWWVPSGNGQLLQFSIFNQPSHDSERERELSFGSHSFPIQTVFIECHEMTKYSHQITHKHTRVLSSLRRRLNAARVFCIWSFIFIVNNKTQSNHSIDASLHRQKKFYAQSALYSLRRRRNAFSKLNDRKRKKLIIIKMMI